MSDLPIPDHFDPKQVGKIFRVDYGNRAIEATTWADKHNISPASDDIARVALLLVDCQNTFCMPGHEMFVRGRSGNGAVDDNVRLCEFVYRNLGVITEIIPTLDTHTALQIFHPIFWVDPEGTHPTGSATIIGTDDVESGAWQVNPAVAESTGRDLEWLKRYALHYVKKLEAGRSPLMIWPYHAMLGGIGHALVSAIEDVVFFHSIARHAATRFEIKGRNHLTENYSVLSPEVIEDSAGEEIEGKNVSLIEHLSGFDRVIVAGQAKSHCVKWTVQDLLDEFRYRDASMVRRIQILGDCTSPVVVPGVIDFTDDADEAFRRFGDAGIGIVRSTDPLEL